MKLRDEDNIRAQVDRLGRPSVEQLNREIARQTHKEAYQRLLCSVLGILAVAVAAIIIVTNLWVTVLQIEGASMNPLLQEDEIILMSRDGKFERGDVIAFTHHDRLHVKRAVAIGGDRVEIGPDGTVSVNGEPLREPYIGETHLGNCDIEFPYQVPPETVFVLGDNRPLSVDSRDSGFGTIGREQVIGKLLFRAWPIGRGRNP
ncbi:MAG: signal peptidase I [Clostridiales bacterium]|nr:signal peptidase I [Clostridiales bacterium]